MSKSPELSSAQIEQICRVVADTDRGLRGSEIAHMLAELKIPDGYAAMTKWKRLYSALVEQVNHDGSTVIVFKFLEHCFEPARGLEDVDRYRWMMVGTNRILMLAGVEVRDDGRCHGAQAADTLSEVQRRTRALRNKLYGYGAHPEVLRCCREELLVDDYFHAVFEASKGLCDRVREMSGLSLDGTKLIDMAFGGKNPYVAFTNLETETARNQQNGLRELLDGVIHMVRNVTAHELRVRWDVNEADAIDMLTEVSYLHKLLDQCTQVPR